MKRFDARKSFFDVLSLPFVAGEDDVAIFIKQVLNKCRGAGGMSKPPVERSN